MRNLFKRQDIIFTIRKLPITIDITGVKDVFILEDDKSRNEFFIKTFNKSSIFITKDVKVANKTLKEKKFDMILLDHDLEDFNDLKDERIESKERTGFHVAEELRDTINADTFCIIHSMNPLGASRMVRAHPFNTCYIPFFILEQAITKDKV